MDERWQVLSEADDYLLHLRLGADCAEGTTQAYATSLALFLTWCDSVGKDWRDVPGQLGRFVFWLQHYDPESGWGTRSAEQAAVVRGARRVNAILAAVRSFYRHEAAIGAFPAEGLAALYEDWTNRSGPFLGEWDQRGPRARHRLRESVEPVDKATDEEVLELLRAAQCARDRFIVISMWRMGVRRGEIMGARREDAHFVPNAQRLGCGVAGPHLHVVRRDNPNGATAKSRRSRAQPADWIVVQAYDQYVAERSAVERAHQSDFLVVGLVGRHAGRPLSPGAVNELLERLSKRASLPRLIHPHMLRHTFATSNAEAGATLDELRELLGHAWITSSQVYLHPSEERLRAAVERVPLRGGGLI